MIFSEIQQYNLPFIIQLRYFKIIFELFRIGLRKGMEIYPVSVEKFQNGAKLYLTKYGQ